MATAKALKLVDPHAKCPEEKRVWTGTGWQCTNHYPPQEVQQPREASIVPGSLADRRRRAGKQEAQPTGQVPHVGGDAVAGLQDEVGRLRGDIAGMGVPQLRAEVTLLRAEVARMNPGKSLEELVSTLASMVDGGRTATETTANAMEVIGKRLDALEVAPKKSS